MKYRVSIQAIDRDGSPIEEEVFKGNVTPKQRDMINNKLVECGLEVEDG
jgi:hypothetical protein